MKLLGVLAVFFLAEAEEGVLIASVVADGHVSEGGGKTLEDLLLSLLHEEELHVAADLIVGSLVDSNQEAPLVRGVETVVHDLAVAKLGLLLEDLLGS